MSRPTVAAAMVLLALPATSPGQEPGGGRGQATREGLAPVELAGVPDWLKTYKFKHDKFTFVRIKYNAAAAQPPADPNAPIELRRRLRGSNISRWATDFPDAELALCRHIEHLAALKSEPIFLELTDSALKLHPFLYLCEPGGLHLTDAEASALRTHLDAGALLMIDDFWGNRDYLHACAELLRVFPDRKPQDVPLDHEIFHCVFDINELPQVPSINAALEGREQGVTWEEYHGPGSREPHFRAITADDGRIMVLLCHNTDLSDGWERAGVHPWYTAEFSVKRALPMGVNIVFYALTRK